MIDFIIYIMEDPVATRNRLREKYQGQSETEAGMAQKLELMNVDLLMGEIQACAIDTEILAHSLSPKPYSLG